MNAQGGYFGNALQAAMVRNDDAMVRLLLAHGADVNTQGGEYGSALHVALSRTDNATFRLLLEHGADVNVTRRDGSNALYMASSEGRDVVVRLLLDHGADMHAQGGYYGNALQTASFHVMRAFGCYSNTERTRMPKGDTMGMRCRPRRQQMAMGLFGYCWSTERT